MTSIESQLKTTDHDEDDSNDEDEAQCVSVLPVLQRADANVPSAAKNSRTVPNQRVIEQFVGHPYLRYHHVVAAGYLDSMQRQFELHVPAEIVTVIGAYFYCYEDGLFQLADYMACMLSKLKQNTVSKRMLHVLIAHFFRPSVACKLTEQRTAFYYSELLRFEFIVPVSFKKEHAFIRFLAHSSNTYYRLH
mmetsp:Transcript_14893/g.23245  ORF Transcript_14893/g.23245 Transcript_14893/m.23245 type:complete len:191 (-) Transcript_14893:342-914(-)